MIYNIDFMIRFFRYGRVILIESYSLAVFLTITPPNGIPVRLTQFIAAGDDSGELLSPADHFTLSGNVYVLLMLKCCTKDNQTDKSYQEFEHRTSMTTCTVR